MNRLYQCIECNNWHEAKDMFHYILIISNCQYCLHERRFRANAAQNIIKYYNLRAGEYDDEILEIEVTLCKVRWILAGKETKYIIFKNYNDMVTKVQNSTDMRKALNENLHALLTKKRKLPVAKEVNNTLGKMLLDVRMELMQNAMSGNSQQISWFNNQKQLTQ